jgi:hypothetical protein
LFYNNSGHIKSGMPYAKWSGGQPKISGTQNTNFNKCFAQEQIQ